MSKLKTTLKEPTIDNRLLDDRGPTGERLNHLNSNYAISDTGIISLRVTQSPIERAVARGTISEQHGRAAAKFFHHWRGSHSDPLQSNWKAELSPTGNSDHNVIPKTELGEFHWRRVGEALAAIHRDMDHCGMSQDATKLLFSVVCYEIPFERAGQMVWHIGSSAAGTLALRYVRSALRVLTIEWGL